MSDKDTDFNDLQRLGGIDAVRGQLGQVLTFPILPPASALPLVAEKGGAALFDDHMRIRKEWEKKIEECEDFDILVYQYVPEIKKTAMPGPSRILLLKRIAKKSGIALAEIKDEKNGAAYSSPDDTPLDEESQLINELNEKHAVVPVGGSVFIVNHEYCPMLERPLLTFSSAASFCLKYRNKKVFHEGEKIGLGEYWLDHPDRRGYEGLVFSPDMPIKGYLNLWTGWGLDPEAGVLDKFWEFVVNIICCGNLEAAGYVRKWLAHMVQRPRELPETAIALRGGEGIGKSTFLKWIMSIVGNTHSINLTSYDQIAGRFSGHLADVLLVHCVEAVWGGDARNAGRLKSLITDPIQPIERKGQEVTQVINFKRVVISSNEGWVVPRGLDDRRFIVLDVSSEKKGDYQYWADIRAEFDNGGAAALFSMLLDEDISDWHPRQIPDCLLHHAWELKIQGADSIVKWLMSLLMRGYVISDKNANEWPERIPVAIMQNNYLTWCTNNQVRHPEHETVVGRELTKYGFKKTRPRVESGARASWYIVPKIDDCRAAFCAALRLPPDVWGEEVEDDGRVYNSAAWS